MVRIACFGLGWVSLVPVFASAQDARSSTAIVSVEPNTTPDASTGLVTSAGQKRMIIFKTDSPPVLDGVLDDPVWTQVAPIEDFHQYEPIDHGEPSERTLVYLTYDEDNFYVAARMWDSEPDQILSLIHI